METLKEKESVKTQDDNSYWFNLVTEYKWLCILLILFALWFFTLDIVDWSKCSFLENLHFTAETGWIGDTIGGITNPLIGIFSILLLFYTLKEQQKFNKKQDEFNKQQIQINQLQEQRDRESRDYNILYEQKKQINELIDNLEVKYTKHGVYFHLKGKSILNITQEEFDVYLLEDKDGFIKIIDNITLISSICSSFLKLNYEAQIPYSSKMVFYIQMESIINGIIKILQLYLINIKTPDWINPKKHIYVLLPTPNNIQSIINRSTTTKNKYRID